MHKKLVAWKIAKSKEDSVVVKEEAVEEELEDKEEEFKDASIITKKEIVKAVKEGKQALIQMIKSRLHIKRSDNVYE